MVQHTDNPSDTCDINRKVLSKMYKSSKETINNYTNVLVTKTHDSSLSSFETSFELR